MIDAPPVAAAAFAPLGLFEHRTGRAVVGRPTELAAIEDAIAGAEAGRLTAVTVEGEPGIGKTRLLLAAREVAGAQGFLTIAVGADEELRGPFLLARSIMGAPEVVEAVSGTASEQAILAAGAALGGRDDPAFAGLSADQRLLRSFDLATMAVRALTAEQPLALLIDDMQWADEDSLRLLRYVIRTERASPIFVLFSIRPEELASLPEGGHADRGHGADARDPAPEARPVLGRGDLGVPPADRSAGRSTLRPRPRSTARPRACRSSWRRSPAPTARPGCSRRRGARGPSDATPSGWRRLRSARSSSAAPHTCPSSPRPPWRRRR